MSIQDQRSGDLGNGYYRNPILNGDYPDVSVIRVESDYYMVHSGMRFVPAMLVWHSRDLVNWEPVCKALSKYIGSIWAPDICVHNGVFFIYFSAPPSNFVITAPRPEGPWSEPIDLKVGHIDPGHVVAPDGRRYLHLSGGHLVELSEDGLSIVGQPRKVYEPWKYPDAWDTEGVCLESPKLLLEGGYYYLTTAQGGTAGPPTGHMVVSARSRSPFGPWEYSPCNPIIRTRSRAEPWWSKGHGTLIDTPDGDWWILYHAYENGYHTLGRHTMLEPIEWTSDGWFRVPDGVSAGAPIKKPKGSLVPGKMMLSDSLQGPELGLQWRFYAEERIPERYRFTDDGLLLEAKGASPGDCSPLTCTAVNRSYRVQVRVKVNGGAEAGLILFYSPECYVGIGFSMDQVFMWLRGRRCLERIPKDTLWLRLENHEHDVSLYYSVDGLRWTKSQVALDSSCFHHNVFGGFSSLAIGLYASGTGHAVFSGFDYRGL
ncbi:family 43 glycosylhydrolase [bacterium]|nr:family 43 glycosylhydrolase [bacterium]